MTIPFTKMSGAGNDFVVVDNRALDLPLTAEQIAGLCDRHFGIGGDGVLAVEPAQNGADFRMRYYNADGGEADMCGNGARCFARFVRPLAPGQDAVRFETPAGVIAAKFCGDEVEVNLTEPEDLRPNLHIKLTAGAATVHVLNTGVPHVVELVDDLDTLDLVARGRELRRHEAFSPAGANANFLQKLDDGLYGIRTYERGVENETLACGTGVTAAAIIAHLVDHAAPPVRIQVRGGDILAVNFTRNGEQFRDVTLRGPADISFRGEIDLDTLRPPAL